MSARDKVQVFYFYYYEGIKIEVGNKDEIDIRPAGETNTYNLDKAEVLEQLEGMRDNEKLFGVPKSFMMECIANAEYREKYNV